MKQPYQAKRVPHKATLRWLKKGFGLASRHVGIWLLLDAVFLAFTLLLTSTLRLPDASVWLVAPLTLLLGAGTFFFTVALGVGLAAYSDGRINLAELRRISFGVKPFRYVGRLFFGSGKLILIPLLGGLLFTATLAAVRSANFDLRSICTSKHSARCQRACTAVPGQYVPQAQYPPLLVRRLRAA